MRHLLALTLAPALAVASALAAVAVPAHAGGSERCDGLVVTIVGTNGPDRLRGTPGRDVIAGLGGADRIEGRGDFDVICGGPGSDRIFGGGGVDLLQGNTGDDRIHGGSGGDVLNGGNGDDLLAPGSSSGGRTSDQLEWPGATRGLVVDLRRGTARGQGRDTIQLIGSVSVSLTDFDDEFTGSRWRDAVWTGHGHDQLRTRGGSDEVTFRGGSDPSTEGDVVNLGPGNDVLRHFDGDLTVHAGPGADLVIERGSGADEIYGGSGNDNLRVRLSDAPGQVVSGDRGHDKVNVTRNSVPGLTWDMETGAALVGDPGTEAVLAGLEVGVLMQTSGTSTVRGTPDRDRISTSSATSFTARGGRDSFTGSSQQDTFDGGSSRDIYVSDPGGPPNTCTSVEADPTGACGP